MLGRKLVLVLLLISVMVFSAGAAETFGSTSGTLPNVTDIRIYDVSETSNKGEGGKLIDSGLNKTFELSQRNKTQYRFTFLIQNDGDDSDWTLEDADNLTHQGLDTNWNEMNRIWYNVSSTENEGQTIYDSGNVRWDTSQGGTLQNTAGEYLWAKYRINISLSQTSSYDQYFFVNDTTDTLDLSNGYSGSYDYHVLNVTKYGTLNVTLHEPPQDTVVQKNQSFQINASVTCENGECGSVDLSARYNESDSADTLIPNDFSSEPFNTNSSNTKNCDNDLKKDETCYLQWFVNATGEVESYHLLDANASSGVGEIPHNDSNDNLVQINKPIILNLGFEEVNFGSLNPGDQNKSANNNSDLLYNVSIDQDSTNNADIWIKSDDLNSSDFPGNYSIPANNLSYSLTEDISTETHLSKTYQKLDSGVSPGTVLTTYYWIDVPYSIYKGFYTGSLYFKANSTG